VRYASGTLASWDGGPAPATGGLYVDQTTILVLLIVAAAVGVVAVAAILDRDRSTAAKTSRATQFASSTEGMRRCPSCGVANLVTADTCSGCGKRLPR